MLNALSLVILSACSLLGAAFAVAASLGLWRDRGFGAPLLACAVRASVTALLVGAIAVVLSFGRPSLFLSVLSNPGSGIFRVSAALVLALLALLALHRALRHGASSPAFVRNLSVIAALFTATATVAVGLVLLMPWRAGWHTTVITLPATAWILPGVFAAFALLLIFEARREGFEDRETVLARAHTARVASGYLCLPVIAAAILLARLAYGDAPSGDPTAARLLAGDLAIPFWCGAGILGCLLPAGLLWRLAQRLLREGVDAPISGSVMLALSALLLECVGFAVFEWCILQLGSVTAWSFFR